MVIQPSTRLGPYEVLSAIGAGGMGEVYKARDTRLDRIVAIKVLPQHLADKPEVRERFEREARTIAGVNHPHICTLYDVGHQDGIDFLVMEYLEGETLATRLLKGRLPLEQVLQYAIEISDALDKAHRKGVMHRDIKPGNVMLTKSGTKLLDFGLAKLTQATAPVALPESQMPTLSKNPTVEGTLLGTLQYMAPEQVEGKVDEIDGRTDIFAFGALLYEMATGKKAFEGKTQASLIAKILEHDPPPMSSLQPMTPATLDRVVNTCLAKDPDERWQTAGDLCRELKWIAENRSHAALLPEFRDKGRHALGKPVAVWALITLLLGGTVGGLAVWELKPPTPQPISRFTITLPPGEQLVAGTNDQAIALSPDGRQLAYVAVRGGTQQVYLRALDGLEAKPVAGTEGGTNPFFSPDSKWLGFIAAGKLKKTLVSGGTPISLVDAANARGASWGTNGTIALGGVAGGGDGMYQVPDSGGAPQRLTLRGKDEVTQRWPEFVVGGNAILFAASTSSVNWTNAQVAAVSIRTGERRNLVQGATQPRYAPSGHLVYAQEGNLMAVPFDSRQLQVAGTAVPVVEGVRESVYGGAAQYSISAAGSLAYIPGGVQGIRNRMVWVSRDGRETPLPAPERNYLTPKLSPDGRQVAVAIDEQDQQVWLYDLSRETSTRLTFAGGDNYNPLWTPDGKRIAFTASKNGLQNMFWQSADGSGVLEGLITTQYSNVPYSWTRDGKLLAYLQSNPKTVYDILVLRLSDRKPTSFLSTPANEFGAQFSPDSRWLVYVSDESGRNEVYLQPYPGPGGKRQVSADGGVEPAWNPNGKELFYRNGDKMMAVDISVQPDLSVGKPRVLFEGQYVPGRLVVRNYDVTADGQRFLMLKPNEEDAAPTRISVVLNWTEELKRRVPTGKTP